MLRLPWSRLSRRFRRLAQSKNRRSRSNVVSPQRSAETLEDRLLLTVLEAGDFVAEIQSLKDVAFVDASNLYVAPTAQQQADFNGLADALLAGNIAGADAQAGSLGYEVVEYTDNVSGDVYHGLREVLVGGVQQTGWGSFFVNLDFHSDALVEVPHPLFDTNSWDVGAKAFREADARGFLMAGAHRNTNGVGTADVAHLSASIFQEVHEAWVGAGANTDAWQVHGFDDANHSFPVGTDAVLSNGDGSISDEVVALDAELEASGFETYAYNLNDPRNGIVNGAENGSTFSSLGGTTNEQGIHSRGLGGIFVHAELEQSIRFNAGNRDLAAEDIAAAVLAESSFQVTDVAPYSTTGPDMLVTVDFDATVDAATLQASDLLVGGAAIATNVTLDDADTATFTIPTQAAGTHSLQIDAGTVSATDGTALGEWSTTFDVATDAQFTINHSPRLQLGDQPLDGYAGSATDRVELLWQTMSAGSGTQDSFAVDYRLAASTDPWIAAPATSQIVIPTGGRINHYTTITGLAYDTDYEYRIRHQQADVIVDEYASTFRTRLDAGDQTVFTFAAYGDSADINDIAPFRSVQDRINTVDPAFAVLLGDNVYDSGTHNESDARFDPDINPEAAAWTAGHIDYVGFGNHDVATDGGQAGEDNFSVPIPIAGVTAPASVPAAEQLEHNYSFDYGNVHFVTFDTNSLNNATRLNDQLTWIEADLAASTAQWNIVFGHHPVTGSPDKPESAANNYYQQVVPRLLAAGVDVFLMGHSHTYHRTYPLTGQSGGVETFVLDTDNDYAKGDGLVQLVTGTGGKSLRNGTFTQYPFNAAGFSLDTTPVVEYGFAQFDVTPTQLTVSYIAADDGATLDQFTITDGPDATPPTATVTTPLDNGPSDLDPATASVSVTTTHATFDIALSDSTAVDDATVTSATVSVTKDAVGLVEATDYTFAYNAASDTITLTSLGGDFTDGTYAITLSGGASTIDDTLGNAMPSTLLSIDIDTSVQVVSFQQGLGGYVGTVDTFVQEASPTASNATATSLNVDNDDPAGSGQDVQTLLRFDNIFGVGVGQIPSNATIQSALLTVNVINLGDPLELHRMLGSWNDTDTWTSLTAGVSADGIEAVATADVTTGSVPTGSVTIDVLSSLQSWLANPGTNFGWAMLPTGTNGVDFNSSEGATPPKLEVQFSTTVVPPTSFYESFENGLSADWTVTSVDPEARVQIRDLNGESLIALQPSIDFTAGGNSNSLTFDSTRASGDNVKDLGHAIWSVDLSAFTGNALLTFHQLEGDGSGSGDENDALPALHTTNAAGDGVSISVNGTDWYVLQELDGSDINRGSDGLWQLHEIDLDAEIARINTAFPSAGLSLSSDVQLKWSQYDDFSFGADGWAIDEIRIDAAADEFTTARPSGAFHRFSLAGETDDDYFYRAGFFGNVTSTTPILVSTHGDTSAFSYESYARRWHRFVADPANGVSSLIVVTPVFGPDGRFDSPNGHHRLSWNESNNAAADLALISTVDTIAASGLGDASELYLWGFSAGGQFTNRFTASHPDRVAAAVVGGAGVQMLPTESVAFPRGFGAVLDSPPPAGVTLSIDDYLGSRVQFWVGENDNDPNHVQLDQSNETTSVQGEDRVERAATQFAAVVDEAASRGISPTDFEFELFIAADDDHTWGEDDLPQIYEFLFRNRNATDLPIEVHPRVVLSASGSDQSASLPQNVGQLDVGQTFFVEFWVAAPNGSTDGVRSGQLDLYFDPAVATLNAAAIDHGSVFGTSTGHTYDVVNDAGFIHNFTGTTAAAGVGVNEYALFGRVELTASAGIIDPTQLVLNLQRSAMLDFQLETLVTHRTDFQPFSSTTVDADNQGVQGVVFEDINGNGTQDATETGLAGRIVEVQATGGGTVTLTRGVEPDDVGVGSYVNNASPWVTLSASGGDVLNAGVRSLTSTGNASTGSRVFSYFFDDGATTSGVGSLWRAGDRELWIDFNAPASSISIDAIGTSSNDVARLQIFDAADTLLGTYTTGVIPAGVVETMTLSNPNIAYAIATGDAQTVRLDNLQFDVQPIITTDTNGQYNLPNLDAGAFNVVAEVPTGWTATSPATSVLAVTITTGQLLTSRDFGQQQTAPLPTVTITATDNAASEAGPDNGTFTVTRTGDTSSPLTVDYSISGDATNGVDYDTLPGSATILAGSSTAIIDITPIDDGDVELTEIVTLTVTGLPTYTVGSPSFDSVSIADDDSPAIVDDYANSDASTNGSFTGTFTDTHASDDVYETLTEQLYGGNKRSRLEHSWTFNVTGGVGVTFFVEAHHNATAEDFRFDYSTDASSWTTLLTLTKNADDDTAQSVVMPTSLSGNVWVRAIDTDRSRGENSADSVFIDEMYFHSELLVGPQLPEVTVTASDANAAEASLDPGEFTITRTGDTAQSLTVNYTITGTAADGTDYQSLTGSLMILAGSAIGTVEVTPIDDIDIEGNETVVLTLASNAAYTIGVSSSGTVTIADDDGSGSTIDRSVTSSTSQGTSSGNHINTHISDGVYQTLTEEGYAGNKRSRLSHEWTFNVTGGSNVTFFVEAHHNSGAENFRFEYSLDGVTWLTMVTVTKTADDNTAQSFALPSGISGTVFVRAMDTDRSRNESSLDSLFVDDMYFLSDQ